MRPVSDQTANAVPDHISPIPRKCLGDLACNPPRCRVGCDVDPCEISAVKPHDHKAIQQFEANGRDHEQIHGSNVRSVVSQKGPLPLAWRPPSLDHAFGDARLRNLKPELGQFAVDARRPPKLILRAHLPDQRALVQSRFAGALPARSISNANSDDSRPDATAPTFRSDHRNDPQD
jgi:hypothetical protein